MSSRSLLVFLSSAAAWLVLAGTAAAGDPAAAREHLKQGFALKEAGRCDEAVPHLVESERMDPQPKTLINLAECQDALKLLVEAEQSLVAARDMATRPEHATLRGIAAARLAALEGRLPRLTLRASDGAPVEGLEITRDGTLLGAVSVGVPLPTNPGKHVVIVRANGHADATYEVTLAEGETREVVVAPGPLAPASTGGASVVPSTPSTQPPTPSRGGGHSAPSPALRTVGWVLGAVGLVGIGVGSALGGVAIARKGAATDCDANLVCGHDSVVALHDAIVAANASTIAFVIGGVALAGGATLVLVSPSGGPGIQVGARW